MKKRYKLAGAWLAISLIFCAVARAEEITTTDGKVYKDVTVIRAEPDGLAVTYRPEGGGMGMGKLKFRNLPENLQRQYEYDEHKAVAYEVKQARGQAVVQAKMVADYREATNRLAKRLDREEAQWRADQEAAAAKLRAQNQFQGGGGGGGGGSNDVLDGPPTAFVRTDQSVAQAQQIQQWNQAASQGDAQAAANLATAKATFTQGLLPTEADYAWKQVQAGFAPNQYHPPGANGTYPALPAQSGPLPVSGKAAAPAGRK